MYTCPVCKGVVRQGDTVCGLCGAGLRVRCPSCGHMTFLAGNCGWCKASLFVACACGGLALISPAGACRRCGKPVLRRNDPI